MQQFKNRICNRCHNSYIPTSPPQKYCGSTTKKEGCSYISYLEKTKERDSKRITIWGPKESKRAKEYRKLHPEVIERQRIKRKQKRLKLRFQLLEKSNFTCKYCGRKPPEVSLEIDHIFPKSKGGINDFENYAVSCKDCNLGKKDSILSEFK